MKKFIIAAVAASLITGPVLAAPSNGNHYAQAQRAERQADRRDDRQDARQERREDRVEARQDRRYAAVQQRHWQRGERFDYRQARNYRVIATPYQYRLREAPRGYRWVQSGEDAVLIGLASGVVAAVLAGVIR